MTLWEKLSQENRLKIETHYKNLPNLGDRLIRSLQSKNFVLELTFADIVDLSSVFTNYDAGEMVNTAYEYFRLS